jgi:predicted lipoprotein with Yx(FWY)xxD motif
MTLPRALVALALAGGVLATAGCDLSDLGNYRDPAAAPAPAATPAPAAAPAMVPAATQLRPATVLRAKAVRKFGTLVVDVHGLVLYRSGKDSARPPVSRCTGACLKTWRPVLLGATDFEVAGVDPALVGTIGRGAGVRQLTLAGWPVYTFAQDRPGTVLGYCKAGFSPITPEGASTTMSG